ncbi:hypothetical protein KC336_g7288 [Hortaea werneckii]|nr:hypothetical protein KC336_g7288 [Hortaea werneckii]
MTAGVFKPASTEHSNDESLSGANSLGLHDAGIDVDAMLKELSDFDLFPPGVAADDSIFDFASFAGRQSGYGLVADTICKD